MAGVFKTYDIRGIYGKEIDTALAYKIGRAFARQSKKDTFMIGYDARTYSEELYQALGHGLVAEGKGVRGIGMVSTPQLHFYQMREGYAGGVMVTASHNPPEYHGFKLYDDRGGSVSYEKGLKEIETLVAGMGEDPVKPGGSFEEVDRIDEYIDFVTGQAKGRKINSKVVIDVGGGSAGRVFRSISEKLALSSFILNEQPDGSFLNRDPNPLKPESRMHAAARVLEHGADLGALLDGDGDRVVFLDEHGESIANYHIAALIAEQLLSEQPGAAVVYDLISSRALPQHIAELGGKPVVSKVGYTFLYDAMIAAGAVFGARILQGHRQLLHRIRSLRAGDAVEASSHAAQTPFKVAGAAARALSSVRGNQHRDRGQGGGAAGDRGQIPGGRRYNRETRRSERGISRVLVQRAAQQHRTTDPPSSGSREP
jgi:phosphomannomutase